MSGILKSIKKGTRDIIHESGNVLKKSGVDKAGKSVTKAVGHTYKNLERIGDAMTDLLTTPYLKIFLITMAIIAIILMLKS